MITPLQSLSRLSLHLGVDLRVKRDDLFPSSGGGNKARKIIPIQEKIVQNGANALITTGGVHSNHARVVAITAAALGVPCYLVLHGDTSELRAPRGNLLLAVLSGAEIDIVEPSLIREKLDLLTQSLKGQGYIPFLIPGGGHCVEGARAFRDAMGELDSQAGGWVPDWIVVASGTGTTQAGLLAGVAQRRWKTRVVGISVARRKPRGEDVVRDSYAELAQLSGLPIDPNSVDFRDDWVGGGYEMADENVLSAIRLMAKFEGIALDPTYTGKAFAGLVDLVRRQEISQGDRVLFWHTGGILNLAVSSYFDK